MAKTFQVNFADRIRAALLATLLRAGIKVSTISLLTMRGRKSGQPHTVLVTLVEQKDASLEAFESEAPRHPVFKITQVEELS